MPYLANLTRPASDPRVLSSGPSSLGTADRLARMLGWFSIGLGTLELVAPRAVERLFGMKGRKRLIRAYGVREIGAGVLSLAPEKDAGLWARLAGDGLDLLALATALRPGNRKRDKVGLAMAMVAGVALLDYVTAQEATTRHARGNGVRRLYHDRSGFPRGLENARGAAKDAARPAAPAAA